MIYQGISLIIFACFLLCLGIEIKVDPLSKVLGFCITLKTLHRSTRMPGAPFFLITSRYVCMLHVWELGWEFSVDPLSIFLLFFGNPFGHRIVEQCPFIIKWNRTGTFNERILLLVCFTLDFWWFICYSKFLSFSDFSFALHGCF